MKRWIAGLLCVLLLCGTLSACAKRRAEEENAIYTGWIATATADPFPGTLSLPPDDEPFGGEALAETFSSMPETDATDFAYVPETSAGAGVQAIRITSYLGSAEDVRVPEKIDGKPVTAIAEGVFADNASLRTLYIPDGVQALGEGILQGTGNILALHTPLLGANAESAQYLGYLFGGTGYENNPKDVPASLTFLSIGEGMRHLPTYALYDCNDLSMLRLPATVKEVGSFAAFNCAKLKAVNLDALEVVGSYAFGGTAIEHMLFGPSLRSIGRGAFEGCGSVCYAVLPFVGGSATENRFLGYIFGAEVADFNAGYVPASLKQIRLLETCTSLAANAFYECATLSYVQLPSTLSSIGARAFSGCERLHTVELPDACTHVGANAFYGCFTLKNLKLGAGLTELGINAFYYCLSLEEVVLPATLQALPASAFAGCRALRHVDFGGVKTVGANAFRGCVALSTVIGFEDVKLEDGNEILKKLIKEEKKK